MGRHCCCGDADRVPIAMGSACTVMRAGDRVPHDEPKATDTAVAQHGPGRGAEGWRCTPTPVLESTPTMGAGAVEAVAIDVQEARALTTGTAEAAGGGGLPRSPCTGEGSGIAMHAHPECRGNGDVWREPGEDTGQGEMAKPLMSGPPSCRVEVSGVTAACCNPWHNRGGCCPPDSMGEGGAQEQTV